jgi:hypothetical protein
MKVLAQRAVYGDVNGAHALIEPKAAALPYLTKITRFTDRPGHLPHHVNWQPYFSGYPFENYYVLSVTFPDPTASRQGMVLTHVLVFNLENAIQMPDLMPALLTLPDTPQKDIDDVRVEIIAPDVIPLVDVTPGLVSVVHHLLEASRGEKPVVWIGQNGFDEIIKGVWRGLWPEARKTFRFRLSFTPQDVEGQGLTIVAIPEGMENRWGEYPRALPLEETETQTEAEAYLLQQPEGASLRALIAELETEPRTILDLKKVEACHEYLKRLRTDGRELSVDGVRMLVRLVGVLSPNVDKGKALKSEALGALMKLTCQGTAADIQALRNFDISPFESGGEKIRKAVMGWIQQHILATESSASRQNADLIQTYLVSDKSSWGKSVQDALRGVLSNWQSNVAKAVWQWWQMIPALIKGIEPLIPNSPRAEADLAENCPSKLPEEAGEEVRLLSQRRGWLVLHAAAVSAYLEPKEALRRQMQVDKDENHFEGLRELVNRVPSASILEIALETGEPRLLRLTGEICAREPGLMTCLDVENVRWRSIWLYEIEAGAPIMAGINNPREVVDKLITLLISGIVIERELLVRMADTAYADLTLHPHRSEAWHYMDAQPRKLFLNATADGWLQRFKADSNFELAVESELEGEILNRLRIAQHVNSAGAGGVSFLINLFRRFTRLSASQFRELVDIALRSGQPVNSFDAVLLGRFVRERGWRDCAKQLAWYLDSRNRRDIAPAVRECQNLLGKFESFMLRFTGKMETGRITEDDWWEALSETAADLYQYGPDQNQLWARAGGDLSSINYNQSGRAGWGEAIRALRRGGGGESITSYKLLIEMRRDFTNNDKLQLLQQWLEGH